MFCVGSYAAAVPNNWTLSSHATASTAGDGDAGQTLLEQTSLQPSV